jgi:hypothetical protein
MILPVASLHGGRRGSAQERCFRSPELVLIAAIRRTIRVLFLVVEIIAAATSAARFRHIPHTLELPLRAFWRWLLDERAFRADIRSLNRGH